MYVSNFFFKSVEKHIKDAESAETDEKSIFRMLRFLFFRVMIILVPKSPQLSIINPWLEKCEAKIYFISIFIIFSTFRIFHKNLATSEGGGGGLHIISWEKAVHSENFFSSKFIVSEIYLFSNLLVFLESSEMYAIPSFIVIGTTKKCVQNFLPKNYSCLRNLKLKCS